MALCGTATARDADRWSRMPGRRWVAVGGMMGAGMGAWVPLWIFVGLVVVVTAGVVVARVLGTRRGPEPLPLPQPESPAVREAKDALRLRYANGEIDREEYLQRKVELED
jgi:putative membrane protein